jgi:hypothetical protein
LFCRVIEKRGRTSKERTDSHHTGNCTNKHYETFQAALSIK